MGKEKKKDNSHWEKGQYKKRKQKTKKKKKKKEERGIECFIFLTFSMKNI